LNLASYILLIKTATEGAASLVKVVMASDLAEIVEVIA
jgi:hypothetical protein